MENDHEITIALHRTPCSLSSCHLLHVNITPYTAKIHLTSSTTASSSKSQAIGHISLYLFHKAKMDAVCPNRMWEECQAFDDYHDGTKLDKIENFLANESFSKEGHDRIDHAEVVLFIDQVWLETKHRGQGRGLAAVRQTARALQLPQKGIVMLQAGDAGGGKSGGVHDAGDKLTRHWKSIGFEEWSESDPSWLLLWLKDVYWV